MRRSSSMCVQSGGSESTIRGKSSASDTRRARDHATSRSAASTQTVLAVAGPLLAEPGRRGPRQSTQRTPPTAPTLTGVPYRAGAPLVRHLEILDAQPADVELVDGQPLDRRSPNREPSDRERAHGPCPERQSRQSDRCPRRRSVHARGDCPRPYEPCSRRASLSTRHGPSLSVRKHYIAEVFQIVIDAAGPWAASVDRVATEALP